MVHQSLNLRNVSGCSWTSRGVGIYPMHMTLSCRAVHFSGDGYTSMPFDEITSLQNSTVKQCVKLRTQRSCRHQLGMVVLAGAQVLEELQEYIDPLELYFVRGQEAPDIAACFPRVIAVTEGIISKISGLESVGQNAVVATVRLPEGEDFLSRPAGSLKRLLALERCQDPGNLGTLLRTAVACAWDGVLLLPGCADPFNEKALRASRGACFKVPIQYGTHQDWEEISEHHGLVRMAAELEYRAASSTTATAKDGSHLSLLETGHLSRFDDPSSQGVSLILGSEGSGLSDEALQGSKRIAIPMPGDMESLNVASAGAVLMWSLGKTGGKLLVQP